MGDPKVKQEMAATPDNTTRIESLENDLAKLLSLVQIQAEQLERQDEIFRIIRLAWFTVAFVLFNLFLGVIFLSIYMSNHSVPAEEQDFFLYVTATPLRAGFISEKVKVTFTLKALLNCVAGSLWGS
jgi:hypothetical protein